MGFLVQGGLCMVMGELEQIRISSFKSLIVTYCLWNTKVFSKAPS
jgi:hypothetical protein